MQAAALISKSPVFLIAVSSVLFMVPHLLNPEVNAGFLLAALNYLTAGIFLAWISLKDGTTELAIGAHAANNLFLGIVVSFAGSALNTPSLFYTSQFNLLADFVQYLIAAAVFYLVVFIVLGRRHGTERPGAGRSADNAREGA